MAEDSLTASAENLLGEGKTTLLRNGFLEVAVVDAHLTGMQAACTRKIKLPSPVSPVFMDLRGQASKSIWAIPQMEFGGFVAAIPDPLTSLR